MTWQLIETAPKDGTPVDLWADHMRFTDCWFMVLNPAFDSREVGWIYPHTIHGSIPMPVTPTHWMPLPAPPVLPIDGEEGK